MRGYLHIISVQKRFASGKNNPPCWFELPSSDLRTIKEINKSSGNEEAHPPCLRFSLNERVQTGNRHLAKRWRIQEKSPFGVKPIPN